MKTKVLVLALMCQARREQQQQQHYEPRKLLLVGSCEVRSVRGVRGESGASEILTWDLERPSSDVRSVGSSDMEPRRLCMRDAGRERLL